MNAASDRKTIVVLGATGQQGGAVARALAAAGLWQLRAVTRNAGSDAARRVAALGCEVAEADMDDADALRRALAGAYGLFSVQDINDGIEAEARRGMAVADAARDAGIEHMAYASVGGAERNSGVPHFESKWRIEEHIRNIGLPASVVRPVFFMENLARPAMRGVVMAALRAWVPADKPLQMVATRDIGEWVARAFADPDRYLGKAEELAGDELTVPQIRAAFRQNGLSAGLPFPVPKMLLGALPSDLRRMFAWFGTDGYEADIAALRTRQPGLMTLRDWLAAM